MATDNSFYAQFVQYDPKGQVDMKRSVALFTERLQEWLNANSQIRPTILAELKEYSRLGEANLIMFTLHRLNMAPTEENRQLIKDEIEKLSEVGKIVYQSAENGSKRGRNVGWVLAEKVKGTTAAA